MLDDLKVIQERDPSDTLGVAGAQMKQAEWEFTVDVRPGADIRNVVLAGMGGSALYAEFYKSWPGATMPFEIVRNYTIPPYVDEHTLFISSSFSGNTEEALEALDSAKKAGATIAAIAAGGKLQTIAEDEGLPLALLDSTIPQPRMSAVNAMKALLSLLVSAGVEDPARIDEYMEAAKATSEKAGEMAASTPTKNNKAKQIALELMGKSPVFYSGKSVFPVANKWKINCNENAKNVAWANYYPEYNHNEFIGWSSHPNDKPYAVVNLHSNFEHPRIERRFEVSDRLLSGKRPAPVDVHLEGDSLIEQLLYGIMLGDHVSIYLGILNGLNPEPVELVETLKKKLVE